MHQEIAIQKITAYLTRQGLTANRLPDRTAAADGAVNPANANEYREYVDTLRNVANA